MIIWKRLSTGICSIVNEKYIQVLGICSLPDTQTIQNIKIFSQVTRICYIQMNIWLNHTVIYNNCIEFSVKIHHFCFDSLKSKILNNLSFKLEKKAFKC